MDRSSSAKKCGMDRALIAPVTPSFAGRRARRLRLGQRRKAGYLPDYKQKNPAPQETGAGDLESLKAREAAIVHPHRQARFVLAIFAPLKSSRQPCGLGY